MSRRLWQSIKSAVYRFLKMTGIVALGDLSVEKDTGQKAKTA
ncbi:hypothetical protein ABEW90_09230 [Bacillus subtilis]|nr:MULTISPECIES: hypothetical protein [Bacillus]AII37993.1 hypothetical protein M036_12100 [Bacillus subtilis TO-A]AKN14486.1 hypothetical protein ABU16_3410 [Bacillus subtilis]EHA31337.1 hypothetical protein BSSC8_17800 [Bacillus subtilis subsp. subtilis str. SC-8]EXF54463.1 hypothetical protein Y647_08735 [Bacillus subtilis QH-1]MDK8208212.1 hypothetical protein [Bacillus subtilis]